MTHDIQEIIYQEITELRIINKSLYIIILLQSVRT